MNEILYIYKLIDEAIATQGHLPTSTVVSDDINQQGFLENTRRAAFLYLSHKARGKRIILKLKSRSKR